MKELREELAEYGHEVWQEWMHHIINKCEIQRYDICRMSIIVPKQLFDKWASLMKTKYKDLSGNKKYDRTILMLEDRVNNMIKIMEKHNEELS